MQQYAEELYARQEAAAKALEPVIVGDTITRRITVRSNTGMISQTRIQRLRKISSTQKQIKQDEQSN